MYAKKENLKQNSAANAFKISQYVTVNPRYNDCISSKRRCHKSEFAVVQNTYICNDQIDV